MRLLPLLLLTACPAEWQDEPVSQVCDEIGYAIASRTHVCEGDPELALDRQRTFDRQYRCIAEEPPAPIGDLYHCPVAIDELSCADVADLGNDLEAWLEASPACAYAAELK